MLKKIVLKDIKTNSYFTNDYENWWSNNIQDAFLYSPLVNTDELIADLIQNNYNRLFDNVEYIEPVIIYKKTK